MPDPTMTARQEMDHLSSLRQASANRTAIQRSIGPAHAALAQYMARTYPSQTASNPDAMTNAVLTGDQANVDAVGQASTKAKNDDGDWWEPGNLIGSAMSVASSAVSAPLSAAGSVLSKVPVLDVAGNAAKAAVRGVTTAASAPFQYLESQAATRFHAATDAVGKIARGDVAGAIPDAFKVELGGPTLNPLENARRLASTTDVGQAVGQAATTGHVDLGSGFFPGGTVAAGQAQAARDVRGTIGGSAWTLGRQAASFVSEPGTAPYRFLSGLTDAAAVIGLDPINKLHTNFLKAGDQVVNAAKFDVATEARTAADFVANHPDAPAGLGAQAHAAADAVIAAAEKDDQKAYGFAVRDLESHVTRVAPGESDAAARFSAGMIDGLHQAIHMPTAEAWSEAHLDLLDRFAADKSFLSISDRLGGRVDPRIVTDLVDADTRGEVADVMRNHLGGGLPVGPSRAYRGPLGEVVRGATDWIGEHRTFGSMPGAKLLTDARTATPGELANATRTLDDALVNAGVGFGERDQLVGNYARSLSGLTQDRYAAGAAAMKAVERQLVGHGIPAEIAAEKTRTIMSDYDMIRRYSIDAYGNDYDHGLAAALADGGHIPIDGLDGFTPSQIVSPVGLEQGLSHAVDLPDARMIRRLTAHPVMRALTTKGVAEGAEAAAYGLPRAPIAAIDWLTGNFKRLATARIALIPRVVGEESAYLAAAGGPSPFSHPLHWLMTATGQWKGRDLLTGELFARAAEDALPSELNEFQQAINVGMDIGRDPYASSKLVHGRRDVTIARKGTDADQWERGLSDSLAQAHADPIKAQVAGGASTDDLVHWANSTEGRPAVEELNAMLNRKGAVYRRPEGDIRLKIPVLDSDGTLNEAVFRTYVDTYARGTVKMLAGDHPDLLGVIAHGHLGQGELVVNNADIAGVVKRGTRGVDFEGGTEPAWAGSTVKMNDGRVVRVLSPGLEGGTSVVTVAKPAWISREPSEELHSVIKDWANDPRAPDQVRYWTRPADRQALGSGDIVSQAANRVTRLFFGHMYGKSSDFMVRSPFWREVYYDEMAKMLPSLAPEEANKALKQLEAQRAGQTGWLKDPQLDAMISGAKSANGTLDYEAADALAKGRALDTMHDTFYDWSRKNQFWDITRNIFPFGQAWQEQLSRWGKLLADDPAYTLRKAQLVVNGAQQSGWVTDDPNNGPVVNIPLTGPLSKLATGVGMPLSWRVQGMVIGTEVLPGVGPVAGLAVSHLLPDVPETDTLEQILFPYGRPTGSATDLLPAWMKNAYSAVFDKRNTTRLYGNTYKDVLQVNAASGKYDMSNQGDVQRMFDDSATQARVLSGMRVIGQFLGPASPTPDYQVATKGGDVLATALSADLDKMRNDDPGNYMSDFLGKYGTDAVVYLTGATRAVAGGLEMTKDFEAWEQHHHDAVTQHPDVAGFFAPASGDFDFAVWRRQLETGQRVRLTDRQIIDASNETLGRWVYRQARTAAGDRPTSQQRLQLANLRDVLAKRYPGFDATGQSSSSKIGLRVEELHAALSRPDMANTDVGKALATYFSGRDAVQAQARKQGVVSFTQARQFAPQREALRVLGDMLAKKYPTFDRVWTDVLDREMAYDAPVAA